MVTELNPDAWTIAMQLDAERANGTLRGYITRANSLFRDVN